MIRSRVIGLLVLAALFYSFPRPASGQAPGGSPPPKPGRTAADSRARAPGILTLVTEPNSAFLSLSGSSGITGRTPLDVPASMIGRYKIVVQGVGFSRSEGSIYIPPKGALPFVASEPRGVSPELILRGFNYPGLPDFTSGHRARGVVLAAAGTSALVMAGTSHLTYRRRLDDPGSANHRTRGAGWLGAMLLTGAGIVVADNHVQQDKTDLKWAKADLSNAAPSEQAQKQLEVDQARRNLQASDDIRRGFVIASVWLHVVNLVDAAVMPLTVPATAPKSSSITPALGPGGAGVAVTLRF